jgi:hypothetical protein
LIGSDDDDSGGSGGCMVSEYSVLMTNIVAFLLLRLDLRLAVVFVTRRVSIM